MLRINFFVKIQEFTILEVFYHKEIIFTIP